MINAAYPNQELKADKPLSGIKKQEMGKSMLNVYDMEKAESLLPQLQLASEKESAAIKSLHLYMKSGGHDEQMLEKLTSDMEKTHSEKMVIYGQLQQFRLDK